MSNLNILVTGGAGFIGSHLTDALIERGHKVTILDNFIQQVHGNGLPSYLNAKAQVVRADICDPQAVAIALEGVQVIFHLAAEVGVGQSMYQPERYMRTNTMGTTTLWEQIRQRKTQIKKLIVASSMSIYGEGEYLCARCGRMSPPLRSIERLKRGQWDLQCPTCGGNLAATPTREDKTLSPNSVYAVSKQDQEQLSLIMGRAYGVPTVALRYFNGYGTRQALSNPYTGVCAIFCSQLLNNRAPVVFEDGLQSRDFVHVSDIVQATVLAMETSTADFQAVNVASGRPINIKDVATLLASRMGKTLTPQVSREYREGDIRHCVADIGSAKRLLGYSPRVSLEDGVDELLNWVKQQSAKDLTRQAAEELAENELVISPAQIFSNRN